MAADAAIPNDRLRAALNAIDAANAEDPHTIEVGGVVQPKEQAHAELMTEWVQRLDPQADDAQLVAARAHHLRRWALPRTDYPEGRAGYLRWRTAQAKRHAAEVADIVIAVGYDGDFAAAVSAIVAKRGLATDPMAEVLAKTMAKMSPAARRIAGDLSLSDRAAALLEAASS